MTNRSHLRVLVAEDDFLVSAEIMHTLLSLGCERVDVAPNGEEAVSLATSLHPDVVLMDIMMPRRDGLEALREIQSRCPTPVVILSAYDDDELVEKAAQAGASAYLVKPPDPREVWRAITIARSRHRDFAILQHKSSLLAARNDHLEAIDSGAVGLKGILTICAHCRKICDDEGKWKDIEQFVTERSAARFSHSICPDCEREHQAEWT